MQIVKITLEFNLDDLVAQNEVKPSVHITVVEPPPPNPLLERLRLEFQEIEAKLSVQQSEILRFMLETTAGLATYYDLASNVWHPEKYPSKGCVRRAVHGLRQRLINLNASHVVSGSRSGVYSFEPTPDKTESK